MVPLPASHPVVSGNAKIRCFQKRTSPVEEISPKSGNICPLTSGVHKKKPRAFPIFDIDLRMGSTGVLV